MPGLITNGLAVGKRKRDDAVPNTNGTKPRKAPKTAAKTDNTQTKILLLEEQILESRTHYNNIVELQSLVNNVTQKPKTATLAAVALCRVFCRLIAGEALVKHNNTSEADAQVVQWLKARLRDYVDSLATNWIGSPDASQESTALTLLMRIVKEETSQGSKRSEQAWRTERSTFNMLVEALLEKTEAEGARQEFVEKYVEEHDDIRFYTFSAVRQYLKAHAEDEEIDDNVVGHAIELLSQIEGVPGSAEQLEDWYGEPPAEKKHQLFSLNAHRKVAQEAWLAIFRSPLTRDHRKAILNIATTRILPWFATRIELLTDFLTDSFNEGGSLSLLALSSIFHLMTQRNLDYPDFYTKLYSLLDDDVMHSKHRSRFFRLLDTFMSSTHLPAAMVASFIKRLARLSLQAPPGAIVWVVPWVYNMLKQHPACTFMLHRPYHPAHSIYTQANPKWSDEGMPNDTFSMSESDPSHTGAIDSSLWELQTLESHYHPNVATLAKILSEQFTKRDYQLEDFLDHSYATLVDAELGRVEMKKTPVVEWEIPKRIVTEEGGGLNRLGGLLENAIALS
ncbi:hypothetical protein LTR36_002586 [Oleoguttula mirabilis]|uniref:CCAAT-binding factor domain-containing protein n=1 Tax=Oleoguttula mirabilis TaxID=1507867 RepID=A0AAV9JKD2_9PEZI|nr:hypothetical protein LTR36_002586 [Oleoguttula mirabilis]